MTARIKISQAGLSAGVAGRSRTDGLATGALVTVEDVSGAGTSTFHLLWGPPEDTTSEASLAATGDPDIWTFSPTAAAYGSYVIELREDGVPVERRIFGIRTPANHLLIPALNERASRHAVWDNDGADQIELCEQNANDFPLSVLNSFRYAGWWRSLYELYRVVEFGIGSLADHGVPLVKLPLAAANTLIANPTGAPATLIEHPFATVAGAGLTYAAGALAVAGSTSITVASDEVRRAALTGDVTAAVNDNATTIANDAVTNAKLANMAANTIKTNPTAGSADPQDTALSAQSTIIRAAANIVQATAAANEVLQRVGSADLGFSTPRSGVAPQLTAAAVSALTTVLNTTATHTIPANLLVAGSRWRVSYTYQFIRGATATALALGSFIQVGGAAVNTSHVSPTGAGTYHMRVEAEFTVLTTGAGGTAMCVLTAVGDSLAFQGAVNLALALDTTGTLAVFGAAQMSVAVANTSITCTGGHVTRVS